MKVIVDKKQRLAKMRAHTWAHLLDSELDKTLGWTKQSWSFVDEDYLRFDFTASKPLTLEQISQMENNINQMIYLSVDVNVYEKTLEDAIAMWAKAVFEDKYGDKVRVVCVSDEGSARALSIELCGGTHVHNTSEIGAFKIIWQEAVASGIRRITAITGPKVGARAVEKDIYITEIAAKLGCPTNQIISQIEKMERENKSYKDEIKNLSNQSLQTSLDKISKDISADKIDKHSLWFFVVNAASYWISEDIKFNEHKNTFTEKFGTDNVLFFVSNGGFLLMWKDAKSIKEKLNLKWWGSETLVVGRDPQVLQVAGR